MRLKTHDEYLKEVEATEYEALEDYINTSTKILHKHKVCGHEWNVRPHNILRGYGCPKCAGTMKKTPSEYRRELGAADYEALEAYQGALTKILHRHKVCGHEWNVVPHSLYIGQGCPKCANVYRRSPKEYRKELEELTPEYEALEDYINNNTKILHKHKICGHEWTTLPRSILSGYGCPVCSKTGFDPTKPAILYYLSVKNGEAYKIGITNHSVKQRYSNEELQDIEVIEEWKFEDGQEAYDLEQIILKSYKHLKYTGKALLKVGNTELFSKNILGGLV